MEPQEKKELLEKIQAAIETTVKDIAALEKLTKPIAPDVAIGRLSRMEAINAKSVNEATLNTARHRLVKLKYALANLDNPDFGICMDCGDPIPVGRIMAMPESNLCVQCAE